MSIVLKRSDENANLQKSVDGMFCDIMIYDDSRLQELVETCLRGLELVGKPISMTIMIGKQSIVYALELAMKLACNSFEAHNEEFEPYGYGLYNVAVCV